MRSKWHREKEDVCKTAREMALRGLVTGASGNVSLRLPGEDGEPLVAITPSQKAYANMTAEDILVVDFEVEPVEGDLVPSSETLLHLAIYEARPDVGAVIHTHSTYATILAVAGIDIPPIIDEMALLVGATIKVADYAFSGTEELAENASRGLGRNKAVILRNHGFLGVGDTLEEALVVCSMVERGAQVLVGALSLGRVNQIPDEALEAARSIYEMRLQAVSKEQSTAEDGGDP